MKFSNSNSFFPNKIYIFATAKEKGTLAQVVEQWTENPCVLGSTPRGTTTSTLKKDSQRKVNKMPSVITSNSYGTFALSGETSIRYHADMAETPKIL